MLTLKEIAAKLGVSVSKARNAIVRAHVTPKGQIGRAHLYYDADLCEIQTALTTIRKYNRAKSTEDTSTDAPVPQPQGGSETAVPAIPQVESDTQAVPVPQPGVPRMWGYSD